LKSQTLRRFTVLFPILAVLVSTFIVSWEYARRSRLTSELNAAEKEYDRLSKLVPNHAASKDHDVHDDHDHDDH
jgi:hypothetical protein